MRSTDIAPGEVYAINTGGEMARGVILSARPHLLTGRRAAGRWAANAGGPAARERMNLRPDPHGRGFGYVGGYTPGSTHRPSDDHERGLPILYPLTWGPAADMTDDVLRALATVATEQGTGSASTTGLTLAVLGTQVVTGVELAVVRPQDVVSTWVEHLEAARVLDAAREKQVDAKIARRVDAAAAKRKVERLLADLGVTPDPELPEDRGPAFETTVGAMSWAQLGTLLHQVASAAGSPELSARVFSPVGGRDE